MELNVETIKYYINAEALTYLKRRSFFGVITPKSAELAIKKGVAKAIAVGEQSVDKVTAELNQFRNETAQKIADLTAKNDEFVSSLQKKVEDANRLAEEMQEKLVTAKAPKTKSRILANGNTEIRRIDKSGAVKVKEMTPDKKNVSVETTTLDGSHRKTTYNPKTGEPVESHIHHNGKRIIYYDKKGGNERWIFE